MKVMKLALLGTAALAAVSVSARADDLSDLKAQIEALNSRISQLEAAPAVPAGYQLLTVSDAPAIVVPSLDVDGAYGKTATSIGIMPTADVPASTTIQWSGYARAALVYSDVSADWDVRSSDGSVISSGSYDNNSVDIYARGQLKVVGTTDTAVGEVGAQIQLRGNFEGLGDASVIMNEAWGWWKMTPDLTLGGGYTGTLANIGYGYDGACTCYYTDNAPVALNPGDRTQMRLSWASGPLSFAVAVEDADLNSYVGNDGLGAAGEIKYAGDTFSGEIAGGYWNDRDSNSNDQWQIGAGLGFSWDPVGISIAAGMGDTGTDGTLSNSDGNTSPISLISDLSYWKASILASVGMTDGIHAEIAYGYSNWDDGVAGAYTGINGDTNAVMAGIYYDPVAQLTIGVEGEYWVTDLSGDAASGNGDTIGLDTTAWSVDLVTVFRF